MNILALDYGLKKIGVALATTPIAEPIGIIHHTLGKDSQISAAVLDRVGRLTQDHAIEKIIVGISEGKSAEQAQTFAQVLRDTFALDVEEVDETLTTHDALSKRAHQKKSKRQTPDDDLAAAVLLQEYLDFH